MQEAMQAMERFGMAISPQGPIPMGATKDQQPLAMQANEVVVEFRVDQPLGMHLENGGGALQHHLLVF